MTTGMKNQKAAVESAHWPLYRFNPELAFEGKNLRLNLILKAAKIPFKEYAYMETRYKMLTKIASGTCRKNLLWKHRRMYQTDGVRTNILQRRRLINRKAQNK